MVALSGKESMGFEIMFGAFRLELLYTLENRCNKIKFFAEVIQLKSRILVLNRTYRDSLLGVNNVQRLILP